MSQRSLGILIAANVLLLIVVGVIGFKCANAPKVVSVDSKQLFDSFAMTKEMKRSGGKIFEAKKSKLDSLYARLQEPGLPEAEKGEMMQTLISDRQEIEAFNQQFAQEQTVRIWERIHGYVNEFSKENGYDMVIGSNGKEQVMFSSPQTDVTKELLNYINKKYEGLQ